MSTQATLSPASDDAIPTFDPATLEPLGDVEVFDRARVVRCIDRARDAQKTWATTSFADRRRVLGDILDHVLTHADELCAEVSRDAGKTREHAMMGEIWPVCEKLRHTIANGERYLKTERVSPGLLLHKKASIEYHPLGVIGVITPWNYPLQNVLGPTVPALMAGNAVVVKVSEWSSASTARIQQIFDEVLRKNGYPTDLVQLVTGFGETGAALVSGGVDKIIFTGSMGNGKRVLAESAKTLTPVILELGGKDALIVCEDAQIEQAAHSAAAGCFITSGQSCLAAERILVNHKVYDTFLKEVVQLAEKLRQGPPLEGDVVDVGAMTSPMQVEVVEKLVNDAVEKGARVLVGGKRNPNYRGHFFEPTVLADVTPDMAIMQEETFGPVMVVCRVRDDDEAVRMTNATQYGLGCTVVSKNPERARRIADAVVTGSVVVNDFGLAYMAQDLPFGGVRGSGFGRLNGREGLRSCTNIKAVLTDRFPIHAPTKIFPVKPGDYEMARGVIRLVYGKGVGAKVNALKDMWRAKGFRK